jgi:hypothetical protein
VIFVRQLYPLGIGDSGGASGGTDQKGIVQSRSSNPDHSTVPLSYCSARQQDAELLPLWYLKSPNLKVGVASNCIERHHTARAVSWNRSGLTDRQTGSIDHVDGRDQRSEDQCLVGRLLLRTEDRTVGLWR